MICVFPINPILLFMELKDGCRCKKQLIIINENYPEIFTIADAKRGDIGIHPQCMQSFF
jgi:hypothetical protein